MDVVVVIEKKALLDPEGKATLAADITDALRDVITSPDDLIRIVFRAGAPQGRESA